MGEVVPGGFPKWSEVVEISGGAQAVMDKLIAARRQGDEALPNMRPEDRVRLSAVINHRELCVLLDYIGMTEQILDDVVEYLQDRNLVVDFNNHVGAEPPPGAA